ncbi:MAG: hypothetical protein ACREBY_20705 [Polaromonas sp.]
MSRELREKIYDAAKFAPPFTVRLTYYDTARLKALAGDKRIVADIIRLAIKEFLDRSERMEEETGI